MLINQYYVYFHLYLFLSFLGIYCNDILITIKKINMKIKLYFR